VFEKIPDPKAQSLLKQFVARHLNSGASELVAYVKAYRALEEAGYARGDDGTWVLKDSPTISDVHVPGIFRFRLPRRRRKPKKDKPAILKRISGNSDIGLNAKGSEDAMRLGERLAARGGLDVLYASPVARAAQTAEALTEADPSLTYQLNSALAPWHLGKYEGRMPEEVGTKIDRLIQNPDDRPPGNGQDAVPGESFNDFKKRIITFVHDAGIEWSKHPDMRLGIVMHSRPLDLIMDWIAAGGPPPDSSFRLRHTQEHNDNLQHGSVWVWRLNDIETQQVDLNLNDPLPGGVYLILHCLTDDDPDDGIELDATEKRYVPPIEAIRDAQASFEAGFTVPEITEKLASGEGLTLDEVERIYEFFGTASNDIEKRAWGGPFAAKWVTRVIRKAYTVEEDFEKADGQWVTVHGVHVFIDKNGVIQKGPRTLIGQHHTAVTHKDVDAVFEDKTPPSIPPKGSPVEAYAENLPHFASFYLKDQEAVKTLRDAYFAQEHGIAPPTEAERQWTEHNQKFDLNDPAVKAQQEFVQAWMRHSYPDGKVKLYRAQLGEPPSNQVSYAHDRTSAVEFKETALQGQGKIVSHTIKVSDIVNASPFIGYLGRADEREVVVNRSVKKNDAVEKQGGGIMVAFTVSPALADLLRVDDGEDSDDMHITLAYLGQVDEVDPERLAFLEDALEGFGLTHGPMTGDISGPARFAATKHSDDKDVAIALFNSPTIQEFRNELVQTIEALGLEVKKNFGYTPHITLAYISPDEDMPVQRIDPVKVTFDQITLYVGGERTDFDLVGYAEPVTKATAVDEGTWVTINGQHVLIGANGEILRGNPKVLGQPKQGDLPLQPAMKLTPVNEKAFNGKQIEVQHKLSKLETGKTAEEAVLAHFHQQGLTDARPLNEKHTNFPIDLVQDHQAIEVKGGLVSNSKAAQQWRATIGQPGKTETAWLKQAGKEEKAAWNDRKSQEILKRKADAVKELSKEHGVKFKGYTMTSIINPDTKTIDLYKFEGFHLRIPWNSPSAKAAYVGTFRYQ
jgi:broad specificity phosphatase PhoE/2'-5' RNA ligase